MHHEPLSSISQAPAIDQRQIRVFIIEDQQCVADGLASLIGADADLEFVGHSASVLDSRAHLETVRPDVCITDLMLGPAFSYNFIQDCTRSGTKAVVFSILDDMDIVRRALKAGACGYIMKSDPWSRLREAVIVANGGGRLLSPSISYALGSPDRMSKDSNLPLLSNRELQVLYLIGAEFRNREVAKKLGISTKTVEAHRENIKSKLSVHSAPELLAFAKRWKADCLRHPSK